MSDRPETFIELCMSGRTTVDQADDFVENWHLGDGSISLRDSLGLSEAEYQLWINDPDALLYVIDARRSQRPLAEVVRETLYRESSGAKGSQAKVKLLTAWLQRQGVALRAG